MTGISFGSICSGIESASVAWEPLGMTPLWFAEIEKFPAAVLAHHWPGVANFGDMCALSAYVASGIAPAPDVLVGGTPCQAFSVAGKRGGLEDERGQLTLKFVELANEIDKQRIGDECVVVWENVPGVLSSSDNAFGCFLGALAGDDHTLEPGPRPAAGKFNRVWRWNKKHGHHVAKWSNAGVVHGPKRTIAWRVLDAQYFGLAQRRRRVFVVASARDGFDPTEVLFEREGVRRDTPPSREAGEETAGTLTSRTTGGGFPGTDETRPTATLDASYGRLQGASGQDLNHGHSTLIPFAHVDLMPTMVSGGSTEASHGSLSGHAKGNYIVPVIDVAHTLRGEGFDASEDGTGRGTPLITCFAQNASGEVREMDVPGAVGTNANSSGRNTPLIRSGPLAVRRLTPVECERLQGFPDNHTVIPWRGKVPGDCPDGPRYKAIGNSKAVPVVRWLGKRILEELNNG